MHLITADVFDLCNQLTSADARAAETPRLKRQWGEVLEECRQLKAGPEERLRIALLNVGYVASIELPFRLLLIRTPQLN